MGLMILFAVIGKRAGWFGKGIVYKVAAEKPMKRTITEIVTANGKIQPTTYVKISPDVSGEIVELLVKEGDEVKRGQLLLKIAPDLYESNLKRLQAGVNQSMANHLNSKARLTQVRAQFKQVELAYNRSKKLFESGAISQAEYENSLSQYEMAKADVEASEQSVSAAVYTIQSAQAGFSEAQENLARTSVYAPMDGVVSSLKIEKGERVVGTVQFSGTEMLQIADMNSIDVVVDVNENDIVRVNLGDTALVEIDAYLGRFFKGIVTEIASSAKSATVASLDQVTNFEVKIQLLKDSYKDLIPANNPKYFPFRPGMSSTVDIQTNTKHNVLSLPIQAITTRSDSFIQSTNTMNQVERKDAQFKKIDKNESMAKGKSKSDLKEVVFVTDKNMAKIREVKTGIQDANYIEILSGLSESDNIITSPYSAISKLLKDGSLILLTDKDKVFEGKNK